MRSTPCAHQHKFSGAPSQTTKMPATQDRPSPSPNITVTPLPTQTVSMATSAGPPKSSSKNSSKSSSAAGGSKAVAAVTTPEDKTKPLSSTQRLEQAVLKVCVETSEKLAVFAKTQNRGRQSR